MTVPDRKLFEYLEDELGRSERDDVERALADSPAARRRLDTLTDMLDQLGRTEEVGGIDLVPAIRGALDPARAGAPSPDRIAGRGRRRGQRALAAGAAVLAAAAGLLVWFATGRGGPAPSPGDEIRVKAEASEASPLDRWVGIDAYMVEGDEAPHRLGARMPAGADLLFAYRNRASEDFRHLMILAVDPAGSVYWFYPAYQEAGADPASIEIARTDGQAVELPDRVGHRFPAGPLVVYALFTRSPVPVSRIEALIAGWVAAGSWDVRRPPRLPVAGSGQHILPTEVVAP
jgi:hypothetical protein